MSDASKRGRSFELEVARILRTKLGARIVRDPKSGAGSHHKSDLKDYYHDLPFDFELKDHEKLNVKASMRQAIEGANVGRVPVLAFRMDEFIIAALKFDDLVSLQVEIQDLRSEVANLRKPLVVGMEVVTDISETRMMQDITKSPAEAIQAARRFSASTTVLCRSGHIADDYGYCMQRDCKYSRGYRPPKETKGGRK